MRTAAILSIALSVPVAASAQDLGPPNPDVVMQCYVNGKPSGNCQFGCGTELAQGGGKETVHWSVVERVEIFHKGATGRADGRSWVLVKFGSGGTPMIAALYISHQVHCHGGLEVKGQANTHGFRFLTFKVD